MRVQIVNVGKTTKASWHVAPSVVKAKNGNENTVYFLESEDNGTSQKIKIGGNEKNYPLDTKFDGSMVTDHGKVEEGDYTIQSIDLPFSSVFVNPKNLNPYIAGFVDEEDTATRKDRIVVMILGEDHQYIRSNVNHNLAEIICTFRTNNGIACVLQVYQDRFDELVSTSNGNERFPLIKIDTKEGDCYKHIRLELNTSNPYDIALTESFVKKLNVIEKLSSLDGNLEKKRTSRRFMRLSSSWITSTFIYPANKMSSEEISRIINERNISSALDEDVSIHVYPINVDEHGLVIKDNVFEDTINNLTKAKVKAFTLVDCKIPNGYYGDLKPLYIFTCDRSDIDTPAATRLKCFKTN
jgi:hypothetical protein